MKENYDFIRNNILSCMFPFQLDCCRIMITLFKIKYEALEMVYYKEYYNDLQTALVDKETALSV